MGHPLVISGKALVGEDLALRSVDIIIEQGVITAVEETSSTPDIWICPALFNAHTHLGDTVAMDCATGGNLAGLVTPPNGLKHRLLAEASHKELVSGMRATIGGMITRGTAGCVDFREGGAEGVAALKEAAYQQPFRCIIFGRDGGELEGDGLGISSARDVPDLERVVARAKQQKKPVAFHAGERDADDIDAALAYDPDFIIHGTHATRTQLRECAERQIPVIICPRSNWTLGVTRTPDHPPVSLMLDLGCRVFLGTDNTMFVQPDMLAEMAFLNTVYHTEPADAVGMAVGGSSLYGSPFFISVGAQANFFTIDPQYSNMRFSKNPVESIVKRAFSIVIGTNVFNS
jgi:cytosine/adenosine deaminase-related metal-dependent hydrolase